MKSPQLETVQVDWMGEQQFLLKDHAGFSILMTQPDGVSGADLLPLSLIGCAAWDVIAILKKQRQQVTGFRVTADSERDPDPPWRFRRIRVHYHITGMKINSDWVRRAIELTETRYCAIYATLREAVEIVSEFDIVEACVIPAESDPVSTLDLIQRFNLAFNRHAVDDVMELMTEDCVFENTYPPPDGERFTGQAAVRACFEEFFRASPSAAFEFGDTFACGKRACVRWRYRWVEPDGQEGHVLGVDVFLVKDGKVAEKCSYVKG